MLRIRAGALHGFRWSMFGFVAAVIIGSAFAAQAAPYADIVVDANSGNVLHATTPDARRHPASLTKIMTLYLLFEQLEAGKLKLDSPLEVSEEAAAQMPTKLGLRAGSTIQVEDAIKGIVTRSANDASVVVAEAIAGDEEEFAKLMTRKAQALGMTRTVYKNASGLPDDDQVTTARDQSILGRAVRERFPSYYKYFSTRSFTFRGQRIGNHNRLLGSVEGVDGIKTGYIRASGFNLVTSVQRGDRHLVAVVMGGSSAASRDAKMRDLISEKIAAASTKRTASLIAAVGGKPNAAGKAESKAEAGEGRTALRRCQRQQRACTLDTVCSSGSADAIGAQSYGTRPAAHRDRLDRADQAGAGEDAHREGRHADRLARLGASSRPGLRGNQSGHWRQRRSSPPSQVPANAQPVPTRGNRSRSSRCCSRRRSERGTGNAGSRQASTRLGHARAARRSRGVAPPFIRRQATSAQRLDDTGRSISGRRGGEAAIVIRTGQSVEDADRRRGVHGKRGEVRHHLLSRPLRRLGQGQGGSRLQISQAQRRRVRGPQELTAIAQQDRVEEERAAEHHTE